MCWWIRALRLCLQHKTDINNNLIYIYWYKIKTSFYGFELNMYLLQPASISQIYYFSKSSVQTMPLHEYFASYQYKVEAPKMIIWHIKQPPLVLQWLMQDLSLEEQYLEHRSYLGIAKLFFYSFQENWLRKMSCFEYFIS